MRREGGKEKMRVGGKTQDSAGKKRQGRCTAKVLFGKLYHLGSNDPSRSR